MTAGPDVTSGSTQDRRERWVHAYEVRTSPLLSALALIYLVTWSAEAIWWQPQALWFRVLAAFGAALWALFALDLLLRYIVTPHRRGFFRHNLLDTITVVIPQFRALRVLRIFTKHGLVSRKGGGLSGGALATALLATALVVWIGSLMVLNAERGAPNAQITDLGTALWWCLQTVTTVGYGDVVPTTWSGQVLAVLVMLVGISVVGSVSASLAATLIKQRGTPTPPAEGAPNAALVAEIQALTVTVRELQTAVAELHTRNTPPTTGE